MDLPLSTNLEPMEAELKEALPEDGDWLYEPKWDGFRCVAFKDADEVELISKAGKPLARYFPDVVEILKSVPSRRFVLDGEIVIPIDGALSFDELLLRIHPAASRVTKLAAEHPGVFIAFDLLVDERGTDLTGKPLRERRRRLDSFAATRFASTPRVRLSPATDQVDIARDWLENSQGDLDGVIAKRADLPYQTGNRAGMVKVKRMRTAECVVGGFRWSKNGSNVASLLLGLYSPDGLLHHVGFCSAFDRKRKVEVDERIPPLRGGGGFTGRAPSGHSRWRKEGSSEWEPVRPEAVVEIQYDHFTGGRFRHGTKFIRWRPDKPPESCRMEQVEREGSGAIELL